jgi:hypothetical protein
MAKNKNRNPDSPESEVEEEESEVEEEFSSSESGQNSGSSRSAEETREVELDRVFTYGGKHYGPGVVELSAEAADSIENKMKTLQEQEEKRKQEGLAALGGSTQTQVNNTVAPMEYFQHERKAEAGNKESEG